MAASSKIDIDHILSQHTLEEKISLLAGEDWWRSAVIDREGVFVPHIKARDGPNGARGESYVSGIKAACFPCGTCLGATFDTSILCRVGEAIAKEAKTKSAQVLLGPTLNETKLKIESFYFFKRYLERRFTYPMEAGRRYTIRLESWATAPEILSAPPLYGKMSQGSGVRFLEHIDLKTRNRDAATVAAECDYTVVCVGTTNEIESGGYDRDTMDLTDDQSKLIHTVIAANPKKVVVNFPGAPVGMTQFVETVPAIVQAWFPGQEYGHTLAAVLSGKVNPSGKLPLSWPKTNEDNPAYGNFPADDDGVLRYAEGLDVSCRWYERPGNPEPLYPFGFGLSYTTFSIVEAVFASSADISNALQTVAIRCKVVNTGAVKGKSVVQLYTRSLQPLPGRARSEKDLLAFLKVEIEAGQEKEVTLELDKDSVSFYNSEHACWAAQKGDYEIFIGLSSVDISHRLPRRVLESFSWNGL